MKLFLALIVSLSLFGSSLEKSIQQKIENAKNVAELVDFTLQIKDSLEESTGPLPDLAVACNQVQAKLLEQGVYVDTTEILSLIFEKENPHLTRLDSPFKPFLMTEENPSISGAVKGLFMNNALAKSGSVKMAGGGMNASRIVSPLAKIPKDALKGYFLQKEA
jgi:hypothetical protein